PLASTLCRSFKRTFVVGDELLDPFSRKLMSYIETIPWAGEIEFLICNWLQIPALAICTPVVEAGLGQRESLRTPLFEDLSRRGDKFHVEGHSSKQVIQVPDAGSQ